MQINYHGLRKNETRIFFAQGLETTELLEPACKIGVLARALPPAKVTALNLPGALPVKCRGPDNRTAGNGERK
jgi:hypothetical protein